MAYIGTDGPDNHVTVTGETESYGAGGNDQLTTNALSYNYIEGGTGNDLLTVASDAGDLAYLFGYGGDGNDIIFGLASADFLNGGGGSDILIGGRPADYDSSLFQGGIPNQYFQTVSGSDTLDGGDGTDAIFGFDGNDTILGGEGNDGADFGNVTTLAPDGKTYSVRAGLFGGTGDDFIDGGRGNDFLDGGLGKDTMLGGLGNDQLLARGEGEVLDGGFGNDTYFAEGAGDTLSDSGGKDTVIAFLEFSIANLLSIENLDLGSDGSYGATGNKLANRITGNEGNNVMDGREGNDFIDGENGVDRITGGLGRDTLVGGKHNDTFFYNSVLESRGASQDTIRDFDDPGAGNDKINLSKVYGPTLKLVGTLTGVGQVHVKQSGADVIVEVNTIGNLAPDLTIRLANTAVGAMGLDDFVL